jgi:cellulose synthase/poly-beta-1,6-N-acetylglucosamine synthase-like glycosyltransferase
MPVFTPEFCRSFLRILQTVALARSYQNVQVIKCNHLKGDAVRTIGVSYANAPIIAFTDADCRPSPQWLEEGLRQLSQEHLSMLAGAIIFSPPEEKRSIVELADSLTSIQQARLVLRGRAAAANLFIARRVFEAAGTFRSDLQFCGDIEFTERAVTAGWSLGYGEKAIVYHPARQTVWSYWSRCARIGCGLLEMGDYKHVFSIAALRPPRHLDQLFPTLRARSWQTKWAIGFIVWLGQLSRFLGGIYYFLRRRSP